VKASREAKERTSWLHPDTAYEEALTSFAESILASEAGRPFLADFLAFQRIVAYYGALNGLAQVLLKITAPGVPDFYQGTELWDFSLVDPDNRRPVDFDTRARLLGALPVEATGDRRGLLRELLANWEDGRIKLYLTARGLRCRRRHADLFTAGDYLPLTVTGARREHVCAFARRHGATWGLIVVPRLTARLTLTGGGEPIEPPGTEPTPAADDLPPLRLPLGLRVWGDTALTLPTDAPLRWRDVLSGAFVAATPASVPTALELPVGALLSDFPVALMLGAPA
jgi:(1->4)-alpha-D-glucan 1-alpha-D-glucosylmutase